MSTVPEIHLPDRLEAVATAVAFVESEAARAGWGVADVTRAVLAVSEAVGNAVEHGGGDLRVRCDATGDTLVLDVTDGGAGPPRGTLETASLPADELARGGRGLFIMKTVADSVHVRDGVVSLRFSRAGRA